MSVKSEEVSVTWHEETSLISSKQPKFSYTRDFLLSLSDLEACKKLPSGFDVSILSEFEDVSHGIPDRQRSGGSLPLQGFRRNEYGSSPPARGDSSSNYSRGLNRWDSRSSGRSDTDSQSDKDSDSGRRHGNQYRRSWQNPEHDGLLGSGSFPRPPGYCGSTVPKFRPNENSQLNRSNEPYHPPRPYKVVPPFRRETDSLNDETFGATDCTEDRVEEEKKRRAEFEMMRKEQHKLLQEKLKLKLEKMEDPLSEMSGVLGNPSNDKILNESDEPVMKLAPQNDTGKLPVSSQATPFRPLVPPGFASTLLEKSSGSKSVVQPSPAEVGKFDRNDIHQDEAKLAEHIVSSKKQSEIASSSTGTIDLTSPLESSSQANVDSHPRKASNISGVFNVLENSKTVEEVAEHNIMGESGHSTSILEKLFGSALTVNDNATPRSSQDLDTGTNEVWSPDTGSSKFAPWFQREEKKPREDASLGKSNDLLSLIVGGEKDGPTMPEMKPTRCDSDVLQMAPNSTATAIESSQQLYYDNKPEAVPAVLTCEDLEQSMLSEVGVNSSKSQLPARGCNALSAEGDQSKANIDNNASQHLLSLLQKGTDSKNISALPVFDDGSSNKQTMFETGKIGESHINTNYSDRVKLSTSERTLTLEALFGTAFMKELQSTNAPVSERKNSVNAFRIDGGAFPTSNDSFISSAANEIEFKGTNRDGIALHSVDKIEGHWLGLEASSNKVELLKRQSELEPKISGFDLPSDIRLPEEDSLISIGDPVGAQNAMLLHDRSAPNSEFLSSSSDGGVDIVGKLRAAVNNKRSVTGQEGLPFLRGPYDMVTPEVPYQNVHAQSSSPPFHPPHVNHGRPIFHPLDSHPSHVDPQMKFMVPDGVIHHDAPMHHPFAGKTIHPLHRHPSSGHPEFDHPAHHPMLQQMHIPDSLPPPHLLQGFPGGMPLPPPSNNPAGYLPEHNPIQGFPFGQPQPNVNGLGMHLPGPEHGGMNNPSDVFQRLMEMEMRSNPKQRRSVPPGSHGRPMHGHEPDTGLWYR